MDSLSRTGAANTNKAGGLSPSQELAHKKVEERRNRAFHELGALLMSGRVQGEPVERLHKLIAGSIEDLGHAELEMSLMRLVQMNQSRNDDVMRLIRSIR